MAAQLEAKREMARRAAAQAESGALLRAQRAAANHASAALGLRHEALGAELLRLASLLQLGGGRERDLLLARMPQRAPHDS